MLSQEPNSKEHSILTARSDRRVAFFLTALAILQGPNACRAAERYVFQVLDQEQGLSNETVTRLARDRQGALWVGTENGLDRYDGHRFLRFTTSEGLPGCRWRRKSVPFWWAEGASGVVTAWLAAGTRM